MGHIHVAHQTGHAPAEQHHDQQEYRCRGQRRAPRRGEEVSFCRRHVAAGLVGAPRKAEITRLHTHREHDQREGYQGIYIGYDAILLAAQPPRIEWREQVTEEAHHDGADAVYGGLFG